MLRLPQHLADRACSKRERCTYYCLVYFKKVIYPGGRVLKCAPPIHSIPLWPNQPLENLQKPQHPSTGHSIAFGLGLRQGFGSGGRRQAPRPNPHTYICARCYTHGTRHSGIVVVHFIVGSFQTHTPRCAYNTTRILLSSLRVCVCVLEFWSRRGCMRR